MRAILTYARSTKGLCRYEEEVAEGSVPLIGAVYLAKTRLGEKPPKRMILTLEESHATD